MDNARSDQMLYDTVRKLADKYLNSSDMEVKNQAGTQLLQAIHTHSRLEESIFYPNLDARHLTI
jgi:hypothetical protein